MLVDITKSPFSIETTIAYATADNFTGQPVYAKALAYLHPEAAEKLAHACKLAEALGLRFKVFDAYRPPEAQWKLWNHTPDPNFLADPRRGSPHSRGVAIDLTLLDEQGKALDMGTPFDFFHTTSHHGDLTIPPHAQANRHLLMGIMTTAGWDFYRNEWWHYQLFNSREYPLISNAESGLAMMES